MTDLTIETAWTCASTMYFGVQVQGSKGDLRTVSFGLLPEAEAARRGVRADWQCDCPGYRYRGACKHIEQVRASGARCAWNAALEPSARPAVDSDGAPCCPRCGGPVRAMRVAV